MNAKECVVINMELVRQNLSISEDIIDTFCEDCLLRITNDMRDAFQEYAGHCHFCKKDLCTGCCIKWSSDIYGNQFRDIENYLTVCRHCTMESRAILAEINNLRNDTNNKIRELVIRFQFKMTEDRGN